MISDVLTLQILCLACWIGLMVALLIISIQARKILVLRKLLAGEFLITINGKTHIARPINATRCEVTHVVAAPHPNEVTR